MEEIQKKIVAIEEERDKRKKQTTELDLSIEKNNEAISKLSTTGSKLKEEESRFKQLKSLSDTLAGFKLPTL